MKTYNVFTEINKTLVWNNLLKVSSNSRLSLPYILRSFQGAVDFIKKKEITKYKKYIKSLLTLDVKSLKNLWDYCNKNQGLLHQLNFVHKT